jgi:hypothetical protein
MLLVVGAHDDDAVVIGGDIAYYPTRREDKLSL